MITKNNESGGLLPHQEEAYTAVKEKFNNSNKAAVVMATGTGKSFVGLQLMVDNKDKNILFMAPTNAIKSQMYKYIAKYVVGKQTSKEEPAKKIAESYFPNMKIITYQSLLRMNQETIKKLDLDVLILDELHRTGAEKWSNKIDMLVNQNKKAKVLGITATPERMDGINVTDEMFKGEVKYELTLMEAMSKGILKKPKYVTADFLLGDELEMLADKIEEMKDEKEKEKLKKLEEKIQKKIEKANGIPELLRENITEKDGKYIIFARNKEHMDELMKEAGEWFKYIDKEPEIYSVYSGEGYTKKSNQKTIKDFEKSDSNHIKLLFSVDMLNEGLHVDVSGVIMARKTESKIIYLQQLGRALSVNAEENIVIDIVNNYTNLSVENKQKEKTLQKASINKNDTEDSDTYRKYNIEENNDDKILEFLEIKGIAQDYVELMNGIGQKRNNILENARAIQEWMKENERTNPPSKSSKNEKEKKLGKALSTIRTEIRKYNNLELKAKEKYIEEKPYMLEVIGIVEEIDENNVPIYVKNARAIQEWMKKNERTNPPTVSSRNEEEKKLGRALSNIRTEIRKYNNLELKEKEKYIKEKPYMLEVIETIEAIDRDNIPIYVKNAREIKEWMKRNERTNPPSSISKNEEEKKLGIELSTIRTEIRKYNNLELKEKEKYIKEKTYMLEVIEIIEEIDRDNIPIYVENARAIQKWVKRNERINPPTESSRSEEEKKLGKALSYIRTEIRKYNNLELKAKEKYIEEKPYMLEVIGIVEEIDENNVPIYVKNARAIQEWMKKNERTNPPTVSSRNEEEKKLGKALSTIRTEIRKYNNLELKAKEKYIEEKPYMLEVIGIVKEIDENKVPAYVKNAREIQEWMKKNERTNPPSQISKNEEEKKLGNALRTIRKEIRKYNNLGQGAKVKHQQKNSYIAEVIEIVEEIDRDKGKEYSELEALVEETKIKTDKLKDLKNLETGYKKLGKVNEKSGAMISEE